MSSWVSWMQRELNFQSLRNLLFERFVEDQQNQQQQQQHQQHQHQRQQSQHGSTSAEREGKREGEREGGEGETTKGRKEGGYSGQT